MGAFLTIGQVSACTGESRDTIRYYERIGLVPKPVRTPAGYRQYREGVVNRLALIRNAQRFGFSLREISAFLGVRDGGGKPCHDVRAAAARMLEAMDRQIAGLVKTRRQMNATLKAWDARLSSTPADRPAFLLDSLKSEAGSRRSRPALRAASTHRPSFQRP
ncbi:MAG: heavy metal-responsive transcriptional regulator [Vicinamibacterales bacterium]